MNSRARWSKAAVVLGCCVGSGCGTFTVQHTAEPLARGQWRGSVISTVQTLRDNEQSATVPGGAVGLAAARGVGHNSEVGGAISTLGVEAFGKTRFWQSNGATPWSLAALVAIGGVQLPARSLISPGTEVHARLIGIATKRTSGCLTWSVGPAVAAYEFWPRNGGSEHGVWFGGFGNLAWQWSPAWTLTPEVSLHRAASGTFPVDGSIAQLTVGVSRTW